MATRLYHCVAPAPGGFRDARLLVGFLRLRGVWLTAEPAPDAQGAVAVDVDLPGELLDWYRVESRVTGERGWCIPADVLNARLLAVRVVAAPRLLLMG